MWSLGVLYGKEILDLMMNYGELHYFLLSENKETLYDMVNTRKVGMYGR